VQFVTDQDVDDRDLKIQILDKSRCGGSTALFQSPTIRIKPTRRSRLGDGNWVLANEDNSSGLVEIMDDHVQSFTGTPLEDLPEMVLRLERKLSHHRSSVIDHDKDVFKKDPPKPISFVNKVFELMKRFLVKNRD
jgi:hypothetical protein